MTEKLLTNNPVHAPTLPKELEDKYRKQFKDEIDQIVSGLKYKWDYAGDWDDPLSEGFSERLTDKLIQILQRIPQGWGYWLSCGPGWYRIIASCDDKLSALSPNYEVHQIKEKFAGLRYYWGAPDYIQGLDPERAWNLMHVISSYYGILASRTCETCGDDGKVHGKGWIYTACDKHVKEFDKDDLVEDNG